MQLDRTTTVGACVIGLMLAAAPASAHIQTRLDRNDTSGPLDLVAARQKHSGMPRKLVLKLVTYDEWQIQDLAGSDTFVSFEFDKDHDGQPERCLDIAVDGSLQATMFRGTFFGCVQQANDRSVGTRLARRPDEHSVKVTIPKRWLGRNAKTYKWRAATSFEQDGHADCAPPDPIPPERRYGACMDFTRWITHSG